MPKVNIISPNPLSLRLLEELMTEVECDSYVINQPLSLDHLNLIVDFSIDGSQTSMRVYTDISPTIKGVRQYQETISPEIVTAYNTLSAMLSPTLTSYLLAMLLNRFKHCVSLLKAFNSTIIRYAKRVTLDQEDWRNDFHYEQFVNRICEMDGNLIFADGVTKKTLVESITNLETIRTIFIRLVCEDDYHTAMFLFHKYRHLVGFETFFFGTKNIDNEFMEMIVKHYQTQLRPTDLVIRCPQGISGIYILYPDMFEGIDRNLMLIKNNRAQFCDEVSTVTAGNTGKEEDQLLGLLSSFIG
jgi:hypothetical protein